MKLFGSSGSGGGSGSGGNGPSTDSGSGSKMNRTFKSLSSSSYAVLRKWFNRSVHARYNPWLRFGASNDSSSHTDLSREKKDGESRISEKEVLSSPTLNEFGTTSSPRGHVRGGSRGVRAPSRADHPIYAGYDGYNSTTGYCYYPPPPSAASIPSVTVAGTTMGTTTPVAVMADRTDVRDSLTALPIMGSTLSGSGGRGGGSGYGIGSGNGSGSGSGNRNVDRSVKVPRQYEHYPRRQQVPMSMPIPMPTPTPVRGSGEIYRTDEYSVRSDDIV